MFAIPCTDISEVPGARTDPVTASLFIPLFLLVHGTEPSPPHPPSPPPFSFITLSALTAQAVGLLEKKISLCIIATCGKLGAFGNTVIYMFQ